MEDQIISTMKDLEERRIYLCRLRFRPLQDDNEQSTLYKRVCEGAFAEMRHKECKKINSCGDCESFSLLDRYAKHAPTPDEQTIYGADF